MCQSSHDMTTTITTTGVINISKANDYSLNSSSSLTCDQNNSNINNKDYGSNHIYILFTTKTSSSTTTTKVIQSSFLVVVSPVTYVYLPSLAVVLNQPLSLLMILV